MNNHDSDPPAPFRVIDAFDHPHGGRILRVRSEGDAPPTLRSLRGATLRARSPEGEECSVRVLGFPLTGGKPSETRYRETGRFDLHIQSEGTDPKVAISWELHPAGG